MTVSWGDLPGNSVAEYIMRIRRKKAPRSGKSEVHAEREICAIE